MRESNDSKPAPDIPEVSLETLIRHYDVLLFDAYGVLVNTTGALPGAVELLQHLTRTGKPFYILTNDASKLPATAAKRYQDYGLPVSPEAVITSGGLLTGYFARQGLKDARCAVLGPADSRRYVEKAGGRIVPAGNDFDVLVIADEAGFPFLETIDRMLTSLFHAIDHQRVVHLVLTNPDIIYPKAHKGFGFGAGSIAGIFEAALRLRYPQQTRLRFTRLGKPEKGLFKEALSRSGTRNMVMIGDQLETDIKGARTFGLDAVLMETGVTTGKLGLIPEPLLPTYRLRCLPKI
jgi:HAD superfamily hydrolase (TIGR01459 family)